jgi:hypothetical protein
MSQRSRIGFIALDGIRRAAKAANRRRPALLDSVTQRT